MKKAGTEHKKKQQALRDKRPAVKRSHGGKPIPGELLPSRTRFRFSSQEQNSKQQAVFTTCIIFQPLTFGRDKKFFQKGKCEIDGTSIIIHLNNQDSEDSKLEGFVETKYKGGVKENNLCLTRNSEAEEKCFVFSKTL